MYITQYMSVLEKCIVGKENFFIPLFLLCPTISAFRRVSREDGEASRSIRRPRYHGDIGKDTIMSDASKRKPRVSEFAKRAGVSASTVSKVINGRSGVSEETRRAVETVLADYGYSRPLVSTKISQTIELVVEYIESNGTIEMIRHASHWALERGCALTVTQTDSGKRRDECFRGIIDRNPLGVIVQMSDMTDDEESLLRSRNIPIVIVDPVTTIGEDEMGIAIDNWTGGFRATEYLLSLGHRRIGVITGPMGTQSAVARYGGYMAALMKAGIQMDPDLVRAGDYLPEKGYEAACRLLDLADRPTAIFACNDLTAVNVYRVARERRIALGTQLSVVGFDDVYPAQYLMPALTTVNQPFDLVARKAVDMIMSVRNGEAVEGHVVLPTSLVVRESTLPPQDSSPLEGPSRDGGN